MQYIYSDDFKNIMKAAIEEKNNLKHPYVGTEHLLLSFLKVGNDSIVNILNSCGLNYEKFKSVLVEYIGIGNINYDIVLYTPLIRNIIDNSFMYSDDNFINENNLFYSFYYSDEGIAKSILNIMNVNIDLK